MIVINFNILFLLPWHYHYYKSKIYIYSRRTTRQTHCIYTLIRFHLTTGTCINRGVYAGLENLIFFVQKSALNSRIFGFFSFANCKWRLKSQNSIFEGAFYISTQLIRHSLYVRWNSLTLPAFYRSDFHSSTPRVFVKPYTLKLFRNDNFVL